MWINFRKISCNTGSYRGQRGVASFLRQSVCVRLQVAAVAQRLSVRLLRFELCSLVGILRIKTSASPRQNFKYRIATGRIKRVPTSFKMD